METMQIFIVVWFVIAIVFTVIFGKMAYYGRNPEKVADRLRKVGGL